MGRRRSNTQKRDEPSTSALAIIPLKVEKSVVPNEIRDSLKFVRKRFLFNIDQIEKRYCSNSSGLVFNLKNDKVEFDAEECDAENDEEVLNNVKRELHKHTVEDYGGTAVISTPAQDPDETDAENIGNWEKLNKLYDVFLSSSLKEEAKAKSQQVVRFKEPLQPIKRQHDSAYQINRSNFKLEPIIENSQHHLPGALFPIFNDNVSIAESHAIEDPVIPLMPAFRTPRRYNAIPDYQSPITRLQRRCLAIEENYDKRTDIIYGEECDFVERWVNESFGEENIPDDI